MTHLSSWWTVHILYTDFPIRKWIRELKYCFMISPSSEKPQWWQEHSNALLLCVRACVFLCLSVCVHACVWREVWDWLQRNSTRGLRGEGESPSYWVTLSSSPILTFPLIALHLPNHVKWACMLTPHSVHSKTHAHPPTHTHTKKAWPVTESHSSTHIVVFPSLKRTLYWLNVFCLNKT